MPIGTDPAMTVSGAAAATTMKTMAPGPSRPASRWGLVSPGLVSPGADARVGALGGESETVAMATSGERQRRAAGADATPRSLTGPPTRVVTRPKHLRNIGVTPNETPVTSLSFGTPLRDTHGTRRRTSVPPPDRKSTRLNSSHANISY